MWYSHKYMTNKNIHILAFVGMPGAGKSSAIQYFSAQGHPRVYTGGVMYDEMRKQNIEITPESQQLFREKMRIKHGANYFMEKSVEQIKNLAAAGQKYITLDGLYTWSEYKYLKHEFPGEMTVVAIVAPRKLRHHRLSIRPERPFNQKEANERDWLEIENLEKGGPIAIADHYIVNDGDIEKLNAKLEDLAQEIHFCKSPIQC